MGFLSAISSLAGIIKGIFYEIEIDIEITPSDSVSAEISIEVEAAEYLYSYRLERWFRADEITPLGTTWGTDEAAITYDGLVLFAFECVWGDGVSVSDVEIPDETPAHVSMLRQILDVPCRDGLVYEVGW